MLVPLFSFTSSQCSSAQVRQLHAMLESSSLKERHPAFEAVAAISSRSGNKREPSVAVTAIEQAHELIS
jgi:hypothetical protein